MTGRHGGVVTLMQAVAPNATWVHCSIHREALAAKGMPESLKNVLDTTVEKVNFVIARPLNFRVFSALCNGMGSDHVMLLQHICAIFFLNDLNLRLQGLSATIFNVRDKIEVMIKKLKCFSVCINKDNTQVFPSLYDFFEQINSSL